MTPKFFIRIFFLFFLFFCVTILSWSEESSNPKAEQSYFTLSTTDNLINLIAKEASFKDILTDLEKTTGIKVKIFNGVKNKKVTLNIKDLPVNEVHTLLRKMDLENFAVVYDSNLSSNIIYVLAEGQNIKDVINDDSIIIAQKKPLNKQPLLPDKVTESSEPLTRTITLKDDESILLNQYIKSSIPPDRQGNVDVVRVARGHRDTVYLRYSINWVEFVDKIPLDESLDITSPISSEKVRSKIHDSLLKKSIINKNEAEKALQTCNPNLKAPVKKLRSPFFNNWTGIHWDAKTDYLALEANAVVDAANNKCVRGIVNLQTSEVVCIKDVACAVK